jgi:hypothetical protein
MASHPKDRKRFTTNKELLVKASLVPLFPSPDRVVFYAEDEGAMLAAVFVSMNTGYTRLDDLLKQTPEGRELWSTLTSGGSPWSYVEEVWWELSWRLARTAQGVVNIFGPKRLEMDQPLSEFRHKYTTGAFANSVLEKMELPELEQNPNVTKILYNGKAFD